MANVTVSVPDELKKKMDANAVINWSEVARRAFSEQLRQLDLLQQITSRSKATGQDIMALSKKIRHGIARKHGLHS